ncbi:MAG TPA: lipid-A-disaccharide synthase [Ignavibacteriaceae bacterium]|nr:lipid-A-disaccharide synthase [Ignavibacteriaceae bacterium]
MMTSNNNILIIAGEVSGDLIGASLLKELRAVQPNINIFGIGGDKMIEEGMNISFHINKLSFLGFVEVVKHLSFIKKVQREILKLVKMKNISTAVLIDYPGFNLSIAKKLKALGLKIIYYISPQIWAWGSSRIEKIRSTIDKMLVIFPFEETLYKNNNVPVEFVGHPMLERIAAHKYLSKTELIKKFKLDDQKEILLLMPGSRKHEVEKIFPAEIEAAAKLSDEFNLQVVVACAQNMNAEIFRNLSVLKNFTLVTENIFDFMNHSKFGIIKSGTATLEAGLHQLPMIIVYKTVWITYLIGKNLVKLESIGLVNILFGEKIIPELIQSEVNADTIYERSKTILTDKTLYQNIKDKLSGLRVKLGTEGASKRAAKIILNTLNETA